MNTNYTLFDRLKLRRRKIQSILVDSRAQFRLTIPFLTLLMINLIGCVTIYWKADQFITNLDIADPKMEADLVRLASTIFRISLGTLTFSGIFCFIFWLFLSHRVFGPIVPIRRHIGQLSKGDFEGRIVLRQHDELKDLANDLNNLTEVLKNSKGQTLLQVMMAAAVGMIVLMATIASQVSVSRQSLGLTQNLAKADLQQQLTRSLADGTLCTQLLTVPKQTFNSSLPNPTLPLTMTSIPLSTAVGAPALVTAGKPVSPITPTLVAASTNTFQITNIVGSSSAGIGTYAAVFQVNFDPKTLVQILRPASVQIVLRTSSSGSTQTVTNCIGGSPQPTRLVGSCENYATYSGTILGNRFCWGLAQDLGTSVKCTSGSTNSTLSLMDDSLSPGEMALNGTDLYANCNGGTAHWCSVAVVGCLF